MLSSYFPFAAESRLLIQYRNAVTPPDDRQTDLDPCGSYQSNEADNQSINRMGERTDGTTIGHEFCTHKNHTPRRPAGPRLPSNESAQRALYFGGAGSPALPALRRQHRENHCHPRVKKDFPVSQSVRLLGAARTPYRPNPHLKHQKAVEKRRKHRKPRSYIAPGTKVAYLTRLPSTQSSSI